MPATSPAAETSPVATTTPSSSSPTAQEPASPTPASAAPAPPATAPAAPAPSAPDVYARAKDTEPLPPKPERGSAADAGNDSEGIYEADNNLTFIGPSGYLMGKGTPGWTLGSIAVAKYEWSFKSPTFLRSAKGLDEIKGSGAFFAKEQILGTYTVADGTQEFLGPLRYSKSNSLATTQAGMAGTWRVDSPVDFDMSITVDAKGNFTGTTAGVVPGACTVSGTVKHLEPAARKNMFAMVLNASNAATGSQLPCNLSATNTYYGMSAIVLVAAGRYDSNGYYRSFGFHATTESAAVISNVLRKQP
ncbi:hypothetical protein [Variovorax rhizosphaerae]|uniref:Uncharacterized protein n=1 Tax=Variovorax rhizosphaerae TaxID=1836200 RepID=A0ABU8WEW3_9BURK